MGALPSLIGIGDNPNSGGAGLNYRAGSTDIQSPVTDDQALTAYNQTQTGLDQQMKFLQALQAQNGIQNQSDVYNQLAGVANGTGPNPALAALKQATGANVANQAALMAGQRGAGANAGLIARQAGQVGGNIQQQAAGQGATLQAQQALGAINAMGGIAGQQVANQAGAVQGYNSAAQGSQKTLLDSVNQANQARVGMKSSENSANAGVSQVAAKGQQDFIGNFTNGASSALMMSKGGRVPNGYVDGGFVSDPTPSGGLDLSAAPAPRAPGVGPQSRTAMALGNAASPASRSMPSSSSNLSGAGEAGKDVGAGIGMGLKSIFSKSSSDESPADGMPNANDWSQVMSYNKGELPSQDQEYAMMKGSSGFSKGGQVPAKVSPGEVYLPPKDVKEVAKGKKSPLAGEKIPGRANVPGDSTKNDTVPKTLQSGGIVIPRSITEGDDAHKKAMAFVSAVLRKQGLR